MDNKLQRAIDHHRAGRLDEAEDGYLSVLQSEPAHPQAHHNLGTLLLQSGNTAAALPHFLAALEADSSNGQYWISYIDALYQSGQVDDAVQVLAMARQQGLQGEAVEELAVRVNGKATAAGASDRPTNREIDTVVSLFGQGRFADAAGASLELTRRYPQHEFGWKALGAIYKQMGNSEAALIPMQKAAALAANDVEAHYNLGVTLQDLGRLHEAEDAYRHALMIAPDYADAHSNLGVTLQSQGRPAEAEACYRRALQLRPDYIAAHYNLGNVLRELGRLDQAMACYRGLLQLKPDYAEAHCSLGNTLTELGRLTDAEVCFRTALQFKADYADAHFNLGRALKELGRLDESIASYRDALAINPDNAQAHYNLGNLFKDLGQMDKALASYRQALLIKPDLLEAHYNLGNVFLDMGRLEDAQHSYRQALQVKPEMFEAHYNLGNTLKRIGLLEEAAASYRQAIRIKPDYAEAHNNLGHIFQDVGRLEEAQACYRQAIRIKPDYLEAHSNLGGILQKYGQLDDAMACFERALEIDPDYADAHNGLAITLHSMNRLHEAVEHFRRTLKIKPDFAVAHSNLIFTLDLMADVDMAALMEERRRWNAAHAAHLYRLQKYSNIPEPQRRLRVGYVSADFRMHSAAYAFGALLTCFDPDNFDVFAYSNSEAFDALTQTFQHSVTAWRNIARLSDDAAADLIREDKIDILVDLSGHSAGNRLLVFARKPAPIQITAFGYAAGTGMGAMDVLFSDPVFVPPEERHFYAEKIVYLPSAIGYCMPGVTPEINALPALSNGSITFASYNRLVKNSDAAYGAWSKILQAIPDSRMVFKTPALDDAQARERVKGRFASLGIAPERIILLGKTSREEHLAAFNRIDIALDPFPQGGGVSALEGLMMGVPVVTLRWPTLAGRVSASILTTMGLTDWIAETPQQYVELAMQKARDLQSLAELRQTLRGRFTSSILGDQSAYTRAVEREYRQLWQEWCALQPA